MVRTTPARALELPGHDRVELLATSTHQDRLVPLIRRRPDDATRLERRAHLYPVLGRRARCEVRAEGRTIGELPEALADEVHSGLLALSLLAPPYVVVVPIELSWSELGTTREVTATAHLALDELRLLAS